MEYFHTGPLVGIMNQIKRMVKKYSWGYMAMKAILRGGEALVFGGNFREKILIELLSRLYRSQFRRAWRWSDEPPHFSNQRWMAFKLLSGESKNQFFFCRGLYSAEILRYEDRVLDIGCGDGFYSNTFFSGQCRHIDAIDVEPTAIQMARRLNPNAKTNYYLLDAVKEPFPAEQYNVIVWDGALGHFSKDAATVVLKKIKESLSPDGLFVGSESLGYEGDDHLQFFDQLSDVAHLLKRFFPFVFLRSMGYEVTGGFKRQEAYWRCGHERTRHDGSGWTDFSHVTAPV